MRRDGRERRHGRFSHWTTTLLSKGLYFVAGQAIAFQLVVIEGTFNTKKRIILENVARGHTTKSRNVYLLLVINVGQRIFRT